MKNVTIIANNSLSRNFIAEDNETLAQVCNHADVIEFFAAADGDEVLNNLVELDGNSVAEAFIPMLKNSQLSDGTTLEFDLEGVQLAEEETADDATDESENVTGRSGVVLVHTSGGLQTTHVAVVFGRTTVREAINDSSVIARSGMTATQLTNCVILLNSEEITPANAAVRTVMPGDEIILTARAASTKGC